MYPQITQITRIKESKKKRHKVQASNLVPLLVYSVIATLFRSRCRCGRAGCCAAPSGKVYTLDKREVIVKNKDLTPLWFLADFAKVAVATTAEKATPTIKEVESVAVCAGLRLNFLGFLPKIALGGNG